jgi:hypothetical protein
MELNNLRAGQYPK